MRSGELGFICVVKTTREQRECGVGEFAKVPGALRWQVVFQKCETAPNTVRDRAQSLFCWWCKQAGTWKWIMDGS